MAKHKLAILTSHPIQYQAPLFQLLAKQPEVDLTVYFCWDFGIKKESLDAEFGKKIKWDLPLLDGYRYKLLNNFSLRPSDRFFGQINPGIIKELKKNNYNLIFIHGWNSVTNCLAIFSAWLFKIPIAIHGDNCFARELTKPPLKRKIKKIILSTIFKRVNFFLYIGKEDRDFYKYHKVADDKLIFMPFAVDNKRFFAQSELLDSQSLRIKNGLKDEVVILFSGKLVERKRPFDLLKAYHQLITVNQQPTILIFVGDGVLRPELEKYVKENNIKTVRFAGFKNQTELPAFYKMADIFVIPSFHEYWGLVVNEAMCFGLPIVASDTVGCIPDLVKENQNGLVYPTGDIDRLAETLGILINDPQKRAVFGGKSKEIIKNYSFDKDMEAILSVLKND